MTRIRSLAIALSMVAVCAVPARAERILGTFSDDVYRSPQKLFTVRSLLGIPYMDNPESSGLASGEDAVALAYLPGGSPLGRRVHGSEELVHGDSWRGMAVVTHDERFYLLMCELRVEALVTKEWTYDPQAADWNAFLPQLEDLYRRIKFR